jgi:thymidylate kinase
VIVEFFGPPGVGKTTFAIALGANLRDVGHATKIYLSSRPGEEPGGPDRPIDGRQRRGPALSDPLRRIARPVVQLIAARMTGDRTYDASTEALVGKLPHGHPVASLRMRQYLLRLATAWREAQGSERIAIFDQAYVQAMASILIAGGPAEREDVMNLVAIAPRADLVIRIDAPVEIVEDRLAHRAQAIGWMGRLFESKQGGPAAYADAVEKLEAGLKRNDRAIIPVHSVGTAELRAEAERVCEEIERVWRLEEVV